MTLGKILAVVLIATLMVLPIVFSVPRPPPDNSATSPSIGPVLRGVTATPFPFTTLPVISSPSTATTSTSSTGVMVPLYTYPTSSTWNEVIQAKLANPSVPIIAIINPDNGPGIAQDSNYVLGIDALRSAGITVLGYVYTQYAQRNLVSVEADINTYHNWYNISGIFFDEMSNVIGNENYYSTLSSYVKSLGYVITAGNPGTSVPTSYIGTVNILNIYENQGLPLTSDLANWTSAYSKQNFAMMSYGVGSINSSYELSASKYVGWIYITNANLPNPYDVLPSYFANEVGALNTTIQPSAVTVNLTVQSVDMLGNPINGPWATIQAPNGSTLATGNTPFNYSAIVGTPYVVTVSNGSYYFNHWSDGNTSNSITFTLTQATTLTAYYETWNTSTTKSTSSTGTSSSQTTVTRNANSNSTSGKSSTSLSTSSRSQQGQPAQAAFSIPIIFTPALIYALTASSTTFFSGVPIVARFSRNNRAKSGFSYGWRW